ncbi:type II toxin-antitoxin system RelE/ParE family toxin [Candidatus Shapirobacteria bacterium]|nr:type II toxin-antitoxin system RelE/ParE family toxin [Candidatus Shapirobacteria bacterium]
MPFAKKIARDLYELRTPGKQKVRVIYSIKLNQIYLVHWFVKKTMKIPARELETAIKRLTLI